VRASAHTAIGLRIFASHIKRLLCAFVNKCDGLIHYLPPPVPFQNFWIATVFSRKWRSQNNTNNEEENITRVACLTKLITDIVYNIHWLLRWIFTEYYIIHWFVQLPRVASQIKSHKTHATG